MLMEQRLASVKAAGGVFSAVGSSNGYNYSNWGYVILGAIAERVTGTQWEDLMRLRIFAPLKMEHVGFGGTGTPGEIDQPWPHIDGKPLPTNGPKVDNPPVMAPAGAIHCSIGDWAKFISNELSGFRDKPSLLTPRTFERMHTPPLGGSYAGGWLSARRGWARGTAYNHAGSNTFNYAVAWLAPQRDVAFLICTNEGNASKPCDDAIGSLIKLYSNTVQ
jgi:CubicO group peptidase (beta-lactamase class C family)